MVGQPIEEVPGIADGRLLGRGGFGDVFVGRELSLDREVAIKLLRVRPDDRTLRSFEREAAALGRLGTHPNIVTLHRVGVTESGFPYLVMEYASGGSLATRLAETGPLPWTEAVDIIQSAAAGLAEAHRQGIRHRDIKPGNIFISAHGVPLLGDFGIATIKDQTVTAGAPITASMAHASPEQVSGTRIDDRSDIYSLASTLYELVVGSAAFVDDDHDLVATIARIATQPPPPLPTEIPAAIREAIAAAMDKDPDRRPASATDFAAMLDVVGPSNRTIVVPPASSAAAGGDGIVPHAAAVVGASDDDITRDVVSVGAATVGGAPAGDPRGNSESGRRSMAAFAALGALFLVAIGAVVAFTQRSDDNGDSTATDPTVITVPTDSPPDSEPVVTGDAEPPATGAAPPNTDTAAPTTARAEVPLDTSGSPTSSSVSSSTEVTTTTEPPLPVRSASISVSADDGYQMYVNGELTRASWMSAEIYEVPLDAGTNVIGVRVNSFEDGPQGVAAHLLLPADPEPSGRFIDPTEWLALAEVDPDDEWSTTDFDAAARGWRRTIAAPRAPNGEVEGLIGLGKSQWAWFDTEATRGHMRLVVNAPQAGPARLAITASSAYILRVNGNGLTSDGWISRDTFTTDLPIGPNVVGIHVMNIVGLGGVVAEVSVDGEPTVSSDQTWRVSGDPSIVEDPAWPTTEFNDAEMVGATGYGFPGEAGTLWPIQFQLWPDNDRAQWIWTGDNVTTATEASVRVVRREFDVPDG